VRNFLAIVLVLIIAGGLVAVKGSQISGLIKAGKAAEQAGPPPESVATAKAGEQVWEGTVSAVGSVVANKGVAVSNDAPGTVSRILFESGANVRAGQVLVELDTSVERAQLASARARKELAASTAKRSRALLESGAIASASSEADEASLKTSSTDADALQAQIERKIAKAPFSGRVGLRLVNLGQYLAPGTPITMLEAVDSVYVDFTLPQQRLDDVKVGMPVRVAREGDAGAPVEGTIAAVEPSVDAATRAMKVRAAIANTGERFRPGMFVTVSVVLPKQAAVVTVPATSIVHASYGDSVFIVGDDAKPKTGKIARQQFVKIGASRGDYVAVLDGVKAGDEVVSAGAFKLRNNAPVIPGAPAKVAPPSLDPRPENR
jgi:membrane fusion protein (multidrug efflux system)